MLKLTETYFIDSDTRNYILIEKNTIKKEESKNFGEDIFTNIGYFGTLEQLKMFIIEKEIKGDLELLNNIEKTIELKETINKRLNNDDKYFMLEVDEYKET